MYLFLLLIQSCSHFKSGVYVQWRKGDTVKSVARRFDSTPAHIVAFNKNVSFKTGEWVFIPQKQGLVELFTSEPSFGDLTDSIEYMRTGTLLWPVPSSYKISSNYGKRWGRPHYGVDIPGKKNSAILSADDGTVIYSGNDLSGYGNMTVVLHSNGLKTIYAHAAKNLTRKGQKVYRGQVIALMGNTGRSTGVHLHFEVRRGKKALNPIAFIKKSRNIVMSYAKSR